MARQSDETPRMDYSGCRRSELIAIATEQAQSLSDMRAVLYRETDALREELRMLQAENRALKETLNSIQEKSVQESAANTPDEDILKERLRPIVAKLLARHRQETQALEQKLAALQTELEQEQEKHSEAEKRQLKLHVREGLGEVSRPFAQGKGVKPTSPKLAPVSRDKLMPFVRERK